jgi:Tol biopolymer transport system component/DNA-binding winged helix-turn-helix (wHTH) protein
MQVLLVLTAFPGKLVTREELQQKLWQGNSFGDFEHGLNAAVNKLREKLGDSATTPKYVETLAGRGYRFIGEVESANNCAALKTHGDAAQVESAEEKIPSLLAHPAKRGWKLWFAFALCVVGAGFLYPWLKMRIEGQLRVIQLQRLTEAPLTSLPGRERSPTFSPDGSQVAFLWDGENNGKGYDLYVKVIGNEKPLRLTNHQGVGSAAWSPDGRSIAITRFAGDNDSGVYLISPIGGPERKVANKESGFAWFGNEITWSPDGKQFAYADQSQGNPPSAAEDAEALYKVSLDSLKRTLINTDCNIVATPAFSPNGDDLAWVCVDNNIGSNSIYLQHLGDGSIVQLLRRRDGIRGIDGRETDAVSCSALHLTVVSYGRWTLLIPIAFLSFPLVTM